MEWVSGNIFIRPMGGREGLQPGDVVGGHTHSFDHTSIFFNGTWHVRKWVQMVREDGSPIEDQWALLVDIEREAPFHLLIEAKAKHEFTFIESKDRLPGRAWCIYSHRTPQGEVVLDHNGWHEAYS